MSRTYKVPSSESSLNPPNKIKISDLQTWGIDTKAVVCDDLGSGQIADFEREIFCHSFDTEITFNKSQFS